MAPEPCLDENTVALLLDGALEEDRRVAVSAHLEGCDQCRALVGSAARAWDGEAEGPPAPGKPARRRKLARGAAVGRYVVLDRVASGGMGSVYAAWDPQLDRKVALKLLHPHLGAAEELIQREAQAMARLSHPNVVAVHDVGRHEDRLFVAMEFVEGETLRHHLRAQRPPWREVVALFLEAGRGLQAAHAAGLVHGDFKPQNVLVGKDGRVRVTDFGLARAAPGRRVPTALDELEQLLSTPLPDSASISPSSSPSSSPPISPLISPSISPPVTPSLSPSLSPAQSPPASGARGGTPAYMAPEQFDGGALDARSDLFGFCASLYEALHGQLPFEGRTPAAIMESIRKGQVRPAPDSGVPGWLDQVVRRGLRADPDQRPASMALLLAELAHDPAIRRRRVALLTALGAALLLGAVVLWQRPDPLGACRESARKLDGIWDPQRRHEVEKAFAATGLPYAADAFTRVAGAFDRFAGGWAQGYAAACEASVRDPRADAAAWLRLACLQQQLAAAQVKSDLFAHADEKLVEDAAAMVSAMDDPGLCLRGSGPSVPPAPEPALRPAVERMRERLARIRSRTEAGRYAEATAEAPDALAAARAIHWAPVEAEALFQQADALAAADQAAPALEAATQAALLAEGARHDQLAAKAWVLATAVAGEQLSRLEQSRDLERHARAAIDRLGGEDALSARLEDVAGMRASRAGQMAQALEHLSAARAHYERSGRRDRMASWLLNDEATVLFALGRNPEALELFGRAAALKEKLLGPMHPDVAITVSNLGSILTQMGRFDEAEKDLLRADAIYRAAVRPDHYLLTAVATNLGDLELARGRPAAALPHYQRAVASAERTGLTEHQFMRQAATGLGRALVALGRSAEAIPLLEKVLPQKPDEVDPVDLADLRFALASARRAAGRDPQKARALAEEARAVYQSTGRRGVTTLAEIDAWLQRTR